MNFSKIAPTLNELLVQVNAINFDQEEIDFQKNIIKKHTKFKSFDQYIENCHFILANIIDLNKVLNGFSYEDDDQITFSGDLNILIIKNLNSSVIEEKKHLVPAIIKTNSRGTKAVSLKPTCSNS